MKICLRPETCDNDMERLKAYAHDVGVDQLWYFPSISACHDADGMMNGRKLIAFKDDLQKDGVSLAIISECISPNVLRGNFDELKKVRRTVVAASEALIDTVFIIFNFFNLKEIPENAWSNLVEFHKRMIDIAESKKIRIATHGLRNPEHIVYSIESYERLLKAAPSEYNGIAFCMGVLHQAGENVVEAVKRFNKKIFFVHVRDLIGKGKEVLPGEGEVNVPQVIIALKNIGYKGILCPEHYPRIGNEPYMGEKSTAMCIGYLKGLLAGLQ